MTAYLVLTENGPILVLTSRFGNPDETLLANLRKRGIDKFLAYEVPVDRVHEFYGLPFEVIAADLEQGPRMRVLDFDGPHIFDCLSMADLGREVCVEH